MEFLKRNGVGLAAILCCCVLGVLLAQQSAPAKRRWRGKTLI